MQKWLMHAIGLLARAGGPLVVLLLVVPAAAGAATAAGPTEPSYAGPEECAQCHVAEGTAWQASSHASAQDSIAQALEVACSGPGPALDCTCLNCHATDYDPAAGTYAHRGVACEACHGPYIPDHPASGLMLLDPSSDPCQDCHANTHAEWLDSPHGEANVPCVGCHQSHSQELRVGESDLCVSCHREERRDSVHLAHSSSGIACAECHVPSNHPDEPAELTAVALVSGRPTAPEHGFRVSASAGCVGCHAAGGDPETVRARVVRAGELEVQATRLAGELKEAREDNRSLQTLSVVTLGLGLGIGGVLGVMLALAAGYVLQKATGR